MEQTNKYNYDLEFTDIYGNTQRVIKNAEPIEDEEGLYDLISGFVNLLKESGWTWIEDLEIVKDKCSCECCCNCEEAIEIDEDEMSEYICEKANITKETLENIQNAQIEYLVDNGIIELEED